MIRKQKNKTLIFVLVALFMLVISLVGRRGVFPAFADTAEYTSVLADLRADENFDENAYPVNSDDYSVRVIQVAESVNGELFVYTYQPCQITTNLVATSINMSLTDKFGGLIIDTSGALVGGIVGDITGGIIGGIIDISGSMMNVAKLYNLTLINSDGVFVKYKVNDFVVGSDIKRYYNITSIYREYLKGIDNETGNDNEITEKAFKVGKLFTVETSYDGIIYSCSDVDVVEINNPYVDYLSYGDWSGWDLIFDTVHWTDIHYIAFSTDRKIDTLKEAEVTYKTQSYHSDGSEYPAKITYGDKSNPQFVTLTGNEEFGVDGNKKYTWESIYRTEDFIKTTNLNSTARAEVEKSEFVLVFLKSSFEEQE